MQKEEHPMKGQELETHRFAKLGISPTAESAVDQPAMWMRLRRSGVLEILLYLGIALIVDVLFFPGIGFIPFHPTPSGLLFF